MAETGKPVWEARVSWTQDEQTLTIAPRIAKGKVIVGAAGGDRPTRGFFAAYDAETGRQALGGFTLFRATPRKALSQRPCERPLPPGTASGGSLVEAAPCGTEFPTTPRGELLYG